MRWGEAWRGRIGAALGLVAVAAMLPLAPSSFAETDGEGGFVEARPLRFVFEVATDNARSVRHRHARRRLIGIDDAIVAGGPATTYPVEVWVHGGYCSGESRPVLDHLRVVKRSGTTKRPGGSVVITAYLRFPSRTGPRDPSLLCAGLAGRVRERIHVHQPPAELGIFDGWFNPPRKVRLLPAR